VLTRIEGREALVESIDKGRSKTQDTTEGQEYHAHGIDKTDKIASADEVIEEPANHRHN